MNINKWTQTKTIIPKRLVFGGGFPRFRWIPKAIKWGSNLSIYWLGTELVWIGKNNAAAVKETR